MTTLGITEQVAYEHAADLRRAAAAYAGAGRAGNRAASRAGRATPRPARAARRSWLAFRRPACATGCEA